MLIMDLSIVFKSFKSIFMWLILSASYLKFFSVPHAFIEFTISGNLTPL